jgi:hypothetical protein
MELRLCRVSGSALRGHSNIEWVPVTRGKDPLGSWQSGTEPFETQLSSPQTQNRREAAALTS